MSATTDAVESAAATPSSKKTSVLKIVGIISIVIGAVMVVVGGVAWGLVSSQLSEQNMSVPADAKSNAGKPVAGPFTAWSMQETIAMHAGKSTDGQTYADLGAVVNEAKETFGEDSDEAAEAQALRNTAMNASLLRSSLFTSILAFGVSFFAIGVGALSVLNGVGFIFAGRRKN